MRTAVIVHGMPLKDMYLDPRTATPSNYHWIPWLQKQLALNDVLAQAPEMPRPYEPDFSAWKRVFEGVPLDRDSTLIGWSAGGGFLARWLSERADVYVRQVVLVAPWIDPRRLRTGSFFEFELASDLGSRAGEFVVFSSDNDGDPSIEESVKRILQAVPSARHRQFHYGHFGHWDMPIAEFPELLEEVLR